MMTIDSVPSAISPLSADSSADYLMCAPMRAFTTSLIRSRATSGWTFALIPKKRAPPVTRPWGRTPVIAVVDGYEWQTSVWRDSKHDRSLLAVPKRARGAKGDGDTVTVRLTVIDPD
jgi:hypothetical protein